MRAESGACSVRGGCRSSTSRAAASRSPTRTGPSSRPRTARSTTTSSCATSSSARGHRFRPHSDTETIVHLYEEHGERFVDHLRGMFAIALWDGRAGRLVLARDRLGKKPLYWRLAERSPDFGSELKAILAGPGRRARRSTARRWTSTSAISTSPRRGRSSRASLSSRRRHPDLGRRRAADRALLGAATSRRRRRDRRGRGGSVLERCSARPSGSGCAATCPVGRLPERRHGFQRRHGADGRAVGRAAPDVLDRLRGRSASTNSVRRGRRRPLLDRATPRRSSGSTRSTLLPDLADALSTSRSPTRRPSRPSASRSSPPQKLKVVLTGDGGDESFGGYRAIGHRRSAASRLAAACPS